MHFRLLIAPGLLLAFVTCFSHAAEPAPASSLKSASWLTGVWKSLPEERMTFEEHWTAPAAGGMVGMFRLLNGDKVSLYEFLMIEQESDAVFMRLRHYRPGMAEMEMAPIRCRLTEATEQKLVFENPDNDKPKRITYVLDDQQQLTVSVETIRDGKAATFKLRFKRS